MKKIYFTSFDFHGEPKYCTKASPHHLLRLCRFHRELAAGKIGFFGYRNRTKLSYSLHLDTLRHIQLLIWCFVERIVVFFFSLFFSTIILDGVESVNCFMSMLLLPLDLIMEKSFSSWVNESWCCLREMMMLNLTWCRNLFDAICDINLMNYYYFNEKKTDHLLAKNP